MYPFLKFNNQALLPVYNLFVGIGAIFGLLFFESQIKKRNIKFDVDKKIYFSLIISIFLGYSGSKFFEMIYKHSNLSLHIFVSTGLTFLGALLSGAISFFIVNRLFKTDNSEAFNLLSPSFLLFHAFGRIGCFFAGCCYGKPTDLFIGVTYPKGVIPIEHLGSTMKLHPVPLYESLFLFLLFFVIIRFVAFEMRTAAYFLGYSFFRFFIEFLRGDYRGFFLTEYLSPSQTISILFFIIGLFLILKSKNKSDMEAGISL